MNNEMTSLHQDYPQKHIKTLYIIGNGFDIELGYPTRYSDFISSKEWCELIKGNPSSRLLSFIDKRKTNNWFDLETLLLEFVSDNENVLTAKEDKYIYNEICNSLISYITRIVEEKQEYIHKLEEENIIKVFLNQLHVSQYCRYYTFNYTSFEYIYCSVTSKDFFDNVPEFTYLHGFCGNFINKDKYCSDSIVLGIADQHAKDINQEFHYMLKSNNPKYHGSNLLSDLAIAENVVIFGHSLSKMDSAYFVDFFSSLNKAKNNKTVIIITKDNDSEVLIKHNLRDMGLNLQKLYSSVKLRFYKTDDLRKDKKGLHEFRDMLNQL